MGWKNNRGETEEQFEARKQREREAAATETNPVPAEINTEVQPGGVVPTPDNFGGDADAGGADGGHGGQAG